MTASPVTNTPSNPEALPTPTGERLLPLKTTRSPMTSRYAGDNASIAQSLTSSTTRRTSIQSDAKPFVTVTLRAYEGTRSKSSGLLRTRAPDTELITTGQYGEHDAREKNNVGSLTLSVSTASDGPTTAPTAASSWTNRRVEEPSTKDGVKDGTLRWSLSTSMVSVNAEERGGTPLSVASMEKENACVDTAVSESDGSAMEAARSPSNVATPALFTVTLACDEVKEKSTGDPSGSLAAMGGERVSG